MKRECFEDVKVVDFTWVGVGPVSTKYLADHGATVVRVESAKSPDMIRTSPPFKDNQPGINRSGYFNYYNTNKYSLALNLKHPLSSKVTRKLVSWADIVAESFTPGTMEKWGLGYEDLKQIKPDIIMYRTCNQGQDGPHAKSPGMGSHMAGLSGFIHLTGWPDKSPVQPFGAYIDWVAVSFGSAMLIAALDYRRKTGKGQCLDLSQFEASLHFLAPLILDYQVNGREENRQGNRCDYAAPHGAYRCRGKDRWCAIAVFTDDEWKAFCKIVGNPEWTKDPRYATVLGRKRNEEELNRWVEGWTENLPAEEVMTRMQSAGVAAGVVEDASDTYQDPQLQYRGIFSVIEHKEMGPYPNLNPPFKLSKTPAQLKMASPCLGEHTEHVCREFLQMTEEEFSELAKSGVFE